MLILLYFPTVLCPFGSRRSKGEVPKAFSEFLRTLAGVVECYGSVDAMQSDEDVKAGTASSAIPAASEGREVVLKAAIASVFAQMDADRKTTALKSLQA